MAFLDFLSDSAIRNAFLSGQSAFVLDSKTYALLWLNGAAASFFGFATLSEALDRDELFDNVVKRQIENGVKSGRPVRLRGQNAACSFLLSPLDDQKKGQFILAQKMPVDSRNNRDDHGARLLKGLESKDISAAIFDGDGNIVVATEKFAVPGNALQIFLASIDDFSPVKTLMKLDRTSVQISAIRLEKEPQRFLVLAVNITQFAYYDQQLTDVSTGNHAPVHFTWKMDKEGRFTDFSRPLREKFADIDQIIGQNLADLDNEFKNCGFFQLNAQLATRQPWQDEKIVFPDNGNSNMIDIALSGMPVFSLDNELCGFRGFGIATIVTGQSLKLNNESGKQENVVDGQPMIAQTSQEAPVEEKSNILTSSERSAFREIAERLRSELQLPLTDRPLAEGAKLPEKNTGGIELPAGEHFIPEARSLLNLLDTATDGVIFLDKEGRIRSFSDAASALTGYEQREVFAHPFTTLFNASSQGAIKNYLAILQSGGSKRLFNRGEHLEIDTKGGADIRVFVTLVPLALGQGYAALLRDMTNVSQPHQPLYDNELLARTIHEIRTPLNAMIGFAEIMGQEQFGKIENERYRGYLRDIISSGKHILTLVNQFLDKAKSRHNDKNHGEEKQNQPAISGGFDVITQLRKSVALLENQANENGIIVRIIMPSRIPMIKIDAQEFRQIIWNLLSNAIRFTPKGGQIVVHLSVQDSDFVKVSVSDNGIGMNEEEMVRALQPYGQVARKDGRSGDAVFVGTGLGLPTTKSLVEKNGGRFILLSKPNQGTTAELFFPLANS